MNYGISILFRAIPLVMAIFCFGYGAFIYGYGDAGGRVVAGPVIFSLGMICIALFCTAATIIRQIIHTYNQAAKYGLPILGYLAAIVTIIGGTTGYIMLGLGLVCYSISSKVILLAKIWRHEFKLANRIPLIPVLTALACLFLAAFVFELATVNADYFIPARVLSGLGAICFTLFSIVSILESGTSSK